MNWENASMSPPGVLTTVFIVLKFQVKVLGHTMPVGGCLAREWLTPWVLSSHHLLQRTDQVSDSEQVSGMMTPGHFPSKPWRTESSWQAMCLSRRHLLFCTLCPLTRFCFLFEFGDKIGNYRTVGVAEHSFQFKRRVYWLLPWMHIENYSEYIIN